MFKIIAIIIRPVILIALGRTVTFDVGLIQEDKLKLRRGKCYSISI